MDKYVRKCNARTEKDKCQPTSYMGTSKILKQTPKVKDVSFFCAHFVTSEIVTLT